MVSILGLSRPVMSVWGYLKNALAADREKRHFRAESDLLNSLHHADFNSGKYIVSLFMKSGRTIVGRIGIDDYDHESYDKHRGLLTIRPEREYPEGVYFELCEVRLSDIEGYLLQEVNHGSPEVMRRLRKEADEAGDIGSAP